MADIQPEVRKEFHWEKRGEVGPTKEIKITVNGNVVFQKTVPAGEKLVGRIAIDGRLEPSP